MEALPETASETAPDGDDDAPRLTPEQRQRLVVARAWWQEGEQALDFFAERTRHEARLAQIAAWLDRLRNEPGLAAPALTPLLGLLRGLAPNRALNRRLLTPDFLDALRDLLFGGTALPIRLARFLAAQPVGTQTASQFLYGAFPGQFPLVSPQTLATINPTRV